jgi:hypothetical protein
MDSDDVDGIPTTRRQWVDLDAESLSHDKADLERLYAMGKYGIPSDKSHV